MAFFHKNTHGNFISKGILMKDEENYDGLQWSESGDHLLIKDISFLTNETLPKYFKHNNLSSFIRQLNMYDFRKST